MSFDLDAAIEVVKNLALQAGALSKQKFGTIPILVKEVKDKTVLKKYITESVTEVDYACQKLILEGLIKEGFNKYTGVIAEEDIDILKEFADNPSLRWVIDPIDGTYNYGTAHEESRKKLEERFGMKIERNHKIYGVSIGLQENQRDFLLGVVYLPFWDELFVAAKGRGATLDGQDIRMDKSKEFNDDLLISLGGRADFGKTVFKRWEQPICVVYSATGVINKHDSYVGASLNLHDVGASTLIIEEAGGYVSDEFGNDIKDTKAFKTGGDKLPYYIAGPSKEFNLALLDKCRKSGFEFK